VWPQTSHNHALCWIVPFRSFVVFFKEENELSERLAELVEREKALRTQTHPDLLYFDGRFSVFARRWSLPPLPPPLTTFPSI
jgi:hypothetical protein